MPRVSRAYSALILILGAVVALSACASSAPPADTSINEETADLSITAQSLCADLNPLSFPESRDLVGSFEAELGVAFSAEAVVAHCEDHPSETIDEAVRAVSSDSSAGASAAPGAEVILTDAWTDSDGYSYSVALSQPTASVTSDVANALPGEVDLSWTYEFTGSITNTTPERNADMPNVYTSPMWPASSVICSTVLVGYTAFSTNDSQDEEWCSLPNAPYPLSIESSQLAVNESASIVTSISQGLPLSVPEASADQIVAEMENPPVWAFGRQTGGTGCLLENGGHVITVATGGFVCAS